MAEVSGFTSPGQRYGELNQDWHSTLKLGVGKETIWISAVCDGHGLFGELVAQVCGEDLMEYLEENLEDCDDDEIEDELRKAFAVAHSSGLELYNRKRLPAEYAYPTNAPHLDMYNICIQEGDLVAKDRCGDPQLVEFGTTCTVVVLRAKQCWVAHVGDSVAVLGQEGEGELEGSYIAERLTRPCHNGFNESEVDRIKKHFSPFSEFTDDGYLAVSMGPWEGTQLAMTRSLSHKLLAQHGVIPEPEIVHRELSDADCILILASDGVWDNINYDEAVRTVASSANDGAEKAVRELVEHAVACSREGVPQDNTTAIVMLLDA